MKRDCDGEQRQQQTSKQPGPAKCIGAPEKPLPLLYLEGRIRYQDDEMRMVRTRAYAPNASAGMANCKGINTNAVARDASAHLVQPR